MSDEPWVGRRRIVWHEAVAPPLVPLDEVKLHVDESGRVRMDPDTKFVKHEQIMTYDEYVAWLAERQRP